MNCKACGLPLEPEDTSCRACGALAVADDDIWRAARAGEEPTQVMPAVASRGALEAADEKHELAAAPPASAPPASVPSHQPVPSQQPVPSGKPVAFGPGSGQGKPGTRRPLVVGVIVGAAVMLAVLAGGFAVAGGLADLFAVSDQTTAASDSSPDPTAAPTEESGATGAPPPQPQPAAELEGFSCSPRELKAPEPGRWRLYRGEFGPRGRFDYLRLKLRRDGDHEETAGVAAELMAPGDVAARHGIEAPSGADVALVVAFHGPVSIGGSWGAQPGYGALRGFRIARGQDGTVYAVLGVRGSGCFTLSGGSWDAGQLDSPTDITLEVEKAGS